MRTSVRNNWTQQWNRFRFCCRAGARVSSHSQTRFQCHQRIWKLSTSKQVWSWFTWLLTLQNFIHRDALKSGILNLRSLILLANRPTLPVCCEFSLQSRLVFNSIHFNLIRRILCLSAVRHCWDYLQSMVVKDSTCWNCHYSQVTSNLTLWSLRLIQTWQVYSHVIQDLIWLQDFIFMAEL